jgi:hypothetical protein
VNPDVLNDILEFSRSVVETKYCRYGSLSMLCCRVQFFESNFRGFYSTTAGKTTDFLRVARHDCGELRVETKHQDSSQCQLASTDNLVL